MKRKIVTKLMAIVLAGVLLTGSVTPGFPAISLLYFSALYSFPVTDNVSIPTIPAYAPVTS